MVPKVQEFLQQKLIKNETGEAYRHYHGVPKVENVGGRTKEHVFKYSSCMVNFSIGRYGYSV